MPSLAPCFQRLCFCCWFLFLCWNYSCQATTTTTTKRVKIQTQYFPDSVPTETVRVDSWSGETVRRGLLHLVGLTAGTTHVGVDPVAQWNVVVNDAAANADQRRSLQVTMEEFRMRLQCDQSEPDINLSGVLQLLQLVPMTRNSVELMCAYREANQVFFKGWNHVDQEYRRHYRNGTYRHIGNTLVTRVIQRQVSQDWPWGKERIVPTNLTMLRELTRVIVDFPDVVFFQANEAGFIPFQFPFLGVSNSPSLQHNDIPWPWPKFVSAEARLYHKAMRGQNFSSAFYSGTHKWTSWARRIPKAAFFSHITDVRRVIFDFAMLRKDLFDVSASLSPSNDLKSWNPDAVPDRFANPRKVPVNSSSAPGSADYIVPLLGHRTYKPERYKYIVVIAGLNGLALADRFPSLLAHSGAVLLLQTTSMRYHFSSKLKPWVHYVPISYNQGDIVEKLLWLREHDDMAQTIARNGMIFAQSYLRLEDCLCYASAVMQTIGEAEANSDILQPFS